MRQRQPRKYEPDHLAWVRQLPCLLCGDNTSTEAAHIRMADIRVAKPITGVGTKPDDKYVLPLCSECHRKQHHRGEERFWTDEGRHHIDPVLIALALHSVTGDHDAGMTIIQSYH